MRHRQLKRPDNDLLEVCFFQNSRKTKQIAENQSRRAELLDKSNASVVSKCSQVLLKWSLLFLFS